MRARKRNANDSDAEKQSEAEMHGGDGDEEREPGQCAGVEAAAATLFEILSTQQQGEDESMHEERGGEEEEVRGWHTKRNERGDLVEQSEETNEYKIRCTC